MALTLRPNCEYCDKDLPPDAPDACICSYECTFCQTCAEKVLSNVCPNCGGGFAPRPIRPARAWQPGTGLMHRPASTERVHLKRSIADIATFILMVKEIPPGER